MIIRKFVVVRAGVILSESDFLCWDCHPVSCMIVPGKEHVKTLAEAVTCIERELVTVVISCRIPAVPKSFKISLRPRKRIVSRDVCVLGTPCEFNLSTIRPTLSLHQLILPV